MASISTDKNGNRTIQFVAGDGKRRSIRLGKLQLKAVREIKSKVEALNSAAIAKISLDRETAEWVGRLEAKLYDKLAVAGLLTKRAGASETTLGAFIDDYLSKRTDIKPQTRENLRIVRCNLVEFFGFDRPLDSLHEGDAEDFRLFLRRRLGDNTVRRRCGRARQFFRAALKRRLIAHNPFGEMRGIAVQANHDKFRFVTRAEAAKILAECPDTQWRLIFALSRFGGLRCPSEHLALRWIDVNWEKGFMTVRSAKTAHFEGKDFRVVPIFPEIRLHLEQAFDEAEPGTSFVITRYRGQGQNLRTQFERIVRRAGLTPWKKPFQNLRSTRETELAESFPIHVVCAWIGNSQAIARKHYLQVTDEHFRRAIQSSCSALQIPVQQPSETASMESQPTDAFLDNAGENDNMRGAASREMTPTGLEPVLPA